MASSAQAQNLFAGSSSSGNIYEFTPGGVQSIFASGLTPLSGGMAFDSVGDLFVANYGTGQDGGSSISKITPSGAKSTFASGLSYPEGLAFNSAGDLFVMNPGYGSGHATIVEFTPSGMQTTFANWWGTDAPTSIAFQGETLPVPEPSVFGLLAVGATTLLVRRRQVRAVPFSFVSTQTK